MSKRIASEAGINEDPANKSEDFSIVSPAKKSRKCYTIEYKMKLLKEVKDSNISAVARKYKIDRTVISRWKLNSEKLEESLESSNHKHEHKNAFRVEGGGRKPLSIDMEEEIFTWIMYRRFNQWVVTWESIKAQALVIARSMNINEFNASQVLL